MIVDGVIRTSSKYALWILTQEPLEDAAEEASG